MISSKAPTDSMIRKFDEKFKDTDSVENCPIVRLESTRKHYKAKITIIDLVSKLTNF